MGAECCSATSNPKNQEIIAQKTQQQIQQYYNAQDQKQLQKKQIEENNLKTKFYGAAGISCSKTMTSQKHSDLENLINSSKQNKLSNKQLQKINQEDSQNDHSKNQLTKKQAVIRNRLSTAEVIEQQASQYLNNMFVNVTN